MSDNKKQEMYAASFALLNNRASSALRLLTEHDFPCLEAPKDSVSISCRDKDSAWNIPFDRPPLKQKETDTLMQWEWTQADEIRIDLLQPIDNVRCDLAVWFTATQGSHFQDHHVHQLLDSSLCGLEIDWSHITQAGFHKICDIQTLSMLDVSWTKLTSVALLSIQKLVQLKCLKLNAQHITPDVISILNQLPIEELHLNQCRIQALSQLSIPSLKEIWLWDSNITDADVRFVQHCTSLERMEMRGCGVQGFRMQELRSATNLKVLNLSATPLKSNALSSLHDLPNLSYLDISHTAVEKWAVQLFKENRKGFHLPSTFIKESS